MESNIFNQISQVPFFYSSILTFIFKVKLLANISQFVRDGENITIAIRQEVRYFQWNGAIANVVQCDLDIYFQGHTFYGNHVIFNMWKTVKASEKCLSTTFIEIDIIHLMALLGMLYIATLTYIFKVTQFLELYKYTISGKQWEITKIAQVGFV